MKKYFLLLCIFFNYQIIKAQVDFFNDTIIKYIVPTSELDANWKNTDFDDSNWKSARKSIGYGEEKDSTKLDKPVTSIYLRYHFTLDSIKNSIKEASLLVDYDDGFIAYLNGVEILRVNLKDKGDFVAFNSVADRSHEIIDKRRAVQPLTGYYIDTILLKNNLRAGENVLSVQVHNDSINGSDIHFDAKMYSLTNRHLSPYVDQWHIIKQVRLDSTLLPIISIETDEMGILSFNGKVSANMKVFYNNGTINRTTDIPNLSCNIGIKIRGNSTLDWPKKSYTVETRDEFGENLDVPLLGLPPENDWVFNGPFADKSNIRNMFAFSLGKDILKEWTPQTRFFELIINGEYLGLYVLIETIKRDSSRVDIKKITPSEISGNDLTGGYIMKIDRNGLEVVYPKPDVIQTDQKKYASNAYWSFTTAARSIDPIEFVDPNKGYKKHLDKESYIDYTIVNELIKNADAYQFSLYMHKNRDDVDSLLKFGPLWDHDLSCGNIHVQNANKTYGWQFNESVCYKMYQKYVFRDTSMVNMFRKRWFELRKTVLHKDSINKRIDSLVAYAGDALKRNYDVWPFDGKKMEIWGYQHPAKTYIEDIAMMKKYLSDRIDWIDTNITKLYYAMPSPVSNNLVGKDNNSEIAFPNPFSSELTYSFTLETVKEYSIDIYTFSGISIYHNKMLGNGLIKGNINSQSFPSGLYYFIVKGSNNSILYSQLIVKE